MSASSTDPRFLEMFPAWLRALGADTAALGEVVSGDGPEPVRRYVVAGLNYLFKSLDLIPDGIDDLGFLDDAFVLRVAASLALAEHALPEGAPGAEVLGRLAADARAVSDFLGGDYPRLEGYVKNLRRGAARGRTVEDIMTDAAVRGAFAAEVQGWSQSFEAPSFSGDPKTLIKLRAFLSAKLP
jgi:uncharacterized membrane protein YkvA (DUF1232 family)